MTATVKFTCASEFLAELARDVDDVHRRIVRVCLRFTPVHGMVPARRVEVVAGYELAAGGIVRMERWTGDYLGEPFDRRALDTADLIQKQIARAATDLGLDIRPGAFDPVAKAAR